MNFVKIFYLLIIIIIIFLEMTLGKFQTGTDFTVDELRHVSDKLKPVECMQLIEAIYSVIPNRNGKLMDESGYDVKIRETPVNTWISKHACLDGLKSWSDQFPVNLDEIEPKARLIMILHLNAIGRSDLGNYLLKEHKNDKRFILKNNFYNNDILRRINEVEKNRSPDLKVHKLAKRSSSSENLKNILLSKNFLVSITVSSLIATIVCGFFLFFIRKRFKSLTCCEKRSRNLYQSRKAVLTNEKGFQCIGSKNDDRYTQISEIDIENGSWYNKKFVETETQTWISETGNERFRVSIEKLGISDDFDLEDKRICQDVKLKKKKNKIERKSKKRVKEDKKSAREYIKVIKDKILPLKSSEERSKKKFNRDHWVCQCFNCKSFDEKKIDEASSCKAKKGSRNKRVNKKVKEDYVGGKNNSRRVKKRKESLKIEDQVPILALYQESKYPKFKSRGEINTERKILRKNLSRVEKSSSSSSEIEFQSNKK